MGFNGKSDKYLTKQEILVIMSKDIIECHNNKNKIGGQMAARNKYLNNKELLKEIHNSKVSYSEFDKPGYDKFDAIVEDFDDLFNEIEEV